MSEPNLSAEPGVYQLHVVLRGSVVSTGAARLRAEYEFPLSPLEVPTVAGDVPVQALAANPSVDLFLHRAKSVRPELANSRENALDLAIICQRLEG